MNRLILSIITILSICMTSRAQAPEGFKYQAVIRDANNTIRINDSIGIQMAIVQDSIGGVSVYKETFRPKTNAYGLVNLEIGSGNVVSGDFTSID